MDPNGPDPNGPGPGPIPYGAGPAHYVITKFKSSCDIFSETRADLERTERIYFFAKLVANSVWTLQTCIPVFDVDFPSIAEESAKNIIGRSIRIFAGKGCSGNAFKVSVAIEVTPLVTS